ncbi:transglycosylase domain-containing protein, partial [Streptomyces sp. NPDC013082]|uniref:transglycosylase domain-containing protein n=1 Tax=Streptomyces sp. NPDC013082 TaxID=3156686 RepID=UPI0033F2F2DC
LRAGWNTVTGKGRQGGSTITQQYVKNYYLGGLRGVHRPAGRAPSPSPRCGARVVRRHPLGRRATFIRSRSPRGRAGGRGVRVRGAPRTR